MQASGESTNEGSLQVKDDATLSACGGHMNNPGQLLAEGTLEVGSDDCDDTSITLDNSGTVLLVGDSWMNVGHVGREQSAKVQNHGTMTLNSEY